MTADPNPTVRELTEEELLERIVPRLPRGSATLLGPGDDAAVVAAPDGRFVVTTDVLVEERHFRRAWSSGADVGWRAVMQNLADVAAMGARPTAVVTSLVVPPDLEVAWVEEFADGFAAACRPHGVGAVGGDLSSGPVIMVSVTAHGDLEGREPVLRAGARPGDRVCHAGVLGRSAAGLALLEAGMGEAQEVGARDAVVGYLRPDPPLAAGPAAAASGVRALMDVSDGLLRDGARMAHACGVQIDLSTQSLRADAEALSGLAQMCGDDPWRWVLSGGEDHGLLAVFGPEVELPERFRQIGTVRAGGGAVTVDGAPPSITGVGWDHFNGA
ncbi:thiamine-phosphate kinase [Ruania halotolerans]|uniref:thiamine-phosphate kinase n=1 Tax=Ruania halotolerans TaxID=2897773 RepID=UPI001E350A56|nr:thiamine-phosphate kinase [Ruania halotolerans]UFU07830.1 thiamine-phosphate kinase [Ruania halotolerans]